MTTTRITAAFVLAACIGLISCKTTQPDLTYMPAPKPPQKLGQVVFANADEGFVLIRLDYGFTAEPGTALYAFAGDAAKAKLVATPEKQKNFLVGNIVKGMPATGQSVVFFPEPEMAPKL